MGRSLCVSLFLFLVFHDKLLFCFSLAFIMPRDISFLNDLCPFVALTFLLGNLGLVSFIVAGKIAVAGKEALVSSL